MPPFVATLCPGDGVSGPLEDEDVLDHGAFLESGIDDGLGSNCLAASSSLIGGYQNAGLAIQDAISERFGREAGEDNRVDGAKTSASQESGDSVPGHWHVDGDCITLPDAHTLEDVSYAANFTEKLSVGNFAALARFIGLVDYCSLFGGKSSIHNQAPSMGKSR